ALVTADRQQEAIQRGARIGGLAPLRIGCPGIWNRLARLQGVADFCPGHNAHGHIQQEMTPRVTRNTKTERAVTETRVAAAPRSNGRRGMAANHARKARFSSDVAVG